MNLYLRDDLLNWQWSEETPMRRVQSKDELKEKVENNVSFVFRNIQSLAPPSAVDKAAYSIPVNRKVSELIQVATSVEELSKMDPTWQPWL